MSRLQHKRADKPRGSHMRLPTRDNIRLMGQVQYRAGTVRRELFRNRLV